MFRSLWDGTLGQQPEAWAVFVFLLAHADADGVVEMTPAAIAARCGFEIQVVRRAIELLETPDPESRTVTQEGRRLVRLSAERSWGWRVTNYAAYRAQTDAERAAAYRRRQHVEGSYRHTPSQGVTPRHQAEGEGEAEGDRYASAPASPAPVHSASRQSVCASASVEHPEFANFYATYPRPAARPAAEQSFRKALARYPDIEPRQLAAAARHYATEACNIDRRYIPHPVRWLDEDRFLEALEKVERVEARARHREAERKQHQEQTPPTDEERRQVRSLLEDFQNKLDMVPAMKLRKNGTNGAGRTDNLGGS